MAKKIFLDESEIPRQWYNIMADIKMNPPVRPDGSPLEPGDLAPVFPMNLIEQEVSAERGIDIPDETHFLPGLHIPTLLRWAGGNDTHHPYR